MHEPDDARSRFKLEVGAGAAAPATARLFISGVLRQLGADEAAVHDYKVVVSELVTAATEEPSGLISIEVAGGTLRVGPVSPRNLHQDSLGAAVIQGILPDAELERHGDVVAVPLPPLGLVET